MVTTFSVRVPGRSVMIGREGGEKLGGGSIGALSGSRRPSSTVRKKKNRNVVAGHGTMFSVASVFVASVLVGVEVCRRLEGEPKGVSS